MSGSQCLNTLRPRRNRRHFVDDIFKCILLNENVLISIKISLKFIPMGPINNIPALVQIMAWRRPGDKPLSEPIMIISLAHICVTRPQWVNSDFKRELISRVKHFKTWTPGTSASLQTRQHRIQIEIQNAETMVCDFASLWWVLFMYQIIYFTLYAHMTTSIMMLDYMVVEVSENNRTRPQLWKNGLQCEDSTFSNLFSNAAHFQIQNPWHKRGTHVLH